MIANRWAWVPGRMTARPLYSPALVVFLGGGSQFGFSSGTAVGWYPLAPGEAWYPWYRTSPRYVSHANANINLGAWPRNSTNHLWRQRPFAVTSVREEDFRRGRPIERHWQPVQPQMIDRAQPNVVPVRPLGRMGRDASVSPRLQGVPPAAVQPAVTARPWSHEVPPAVREQFRAQREQDRLQRQAESAARDQIRQQQEERMNAQRNAGRVDPGQPQRNAGRVDPGQPQRDAGRVQTDLGGPFDHGNRRSEPMHLHRQVQPPAQAQAVPVPGQQAVPVVREERGGEATAAPRQGGEGGHGHHHGDAGRGGNAGGRR
jgi:hypothetical protein